MLFCPEIVFRGAELAYAEYSCLRPWQTAYLHLLCLKKCVYSCWACLSFVFVSSSLADCLFACSLPHKLFLEVLGLPKLSTCVVVLGRLPSCAFSAQKIVFRGAGLAEADSLCRRPWQTAYLRVLCPNIVFRGAGLAEDEY